MYSVREKNKIVENLRIETLLNRCVENAMRVEIIKLNQGKGKIIIENLRIGTLLNRCVVNAMRVKKLEIREKAKK